MNYLIEFDSMPWTAPAAGVRYKAFVHGRQQIRLVEFSEGFVEPDWCRRGHAGYILQGSFANDYSGELEHYKQGDVLFIPAGEDAKHKVVMAKGEKVTLLLFEQID